MLLPRHNTRFPLTANGKSLRAPTWDTSAPRPTTEQLTPFQKFPHTHTHRVPVDRLLLASAATDKLAAANGPHLHGLAVGQVFELGKLWPWKVEFPNRYKCSRRRIQDNAASSSQTINETTTNDRTRSDRSVQMERSSEVAKADPGARAQCSTPPSRWLSCPPSRSFGP